MLDKKTAPRIRLTNDEYQFIEQYRQIKEHAYNKGKKREEGDTLTIESKLAKSVKDIVKEFEIDEEVWECMSFTPGNWSTPVKAKFRAKLEDEEITATLPILIENRKSSAVFKKRIDIVDYEGFKKDLIEDLKNYSPKIKLKKSKTHKSRNLLEITIPDVHLGKMAWAEETGDADYDLKIAIDGFKAAILDLVGRSLEQYNFERVVFIVGNDLFNSDNAYPYTMTTAGTPQQDDTRWQKVFREGRKLMIWAIELLKEVAPVDVLIIPGNHDFQKSFYLGNVLEVKYENDMNVNVDNTPTTRKFYRWGSAMIGFAHGNGKDEKPDRLIASMENDAPKVCDVDWREIKFKEWHCGDIHHFKELSTRGGNKDLSNYGEDYNGVMIKYLRTLMLRDEWEAKKVYTSQKGAHVFVWNKESGNITENKYNK